MATLLSLLFNLFLDISQVKRYSPTHYALTVINTLIDVRIMCNNN